MRRSTPPAATLPADLSDDPPAGSAVAAEDDCPAGGYRTPGDGLRPRWTRREDYAPEALVAALASAPAGCRRAGGRSATQGDCGSRPAGQYRRMTRALAPVTGVMLMLQLKRNNVPLSDSKCSGRRLGCSEPLRY